MALAWKVRLREWRTVLAAKGVKVSTWALVRAVLSGPVPADVWRERIRTCARCPVKSRTGWVCGRTLPDGSKIGCNCYLPLLALTAVPYSPEGGCWGREVSKDFKPAERIGWVARPFKSRWAKIRAVWRFVFNLHSK